MAPTNPSRNISVLVVDDNPETREILERYLGDEGFDVIQATDGIDALSYMYATKPSMVLIDLMMPRMNGLELIAQLRHERAFADIPVVAMSGSPEMLPRATAAGANDVLCKPVEPGVVLSTLLRHGRPKKRPASS
ncbi:MAG: response regulator [Myxococcota bacterium]|nr:response regulator [Myxococcota bacterium]